MISDIDKKNIDDAIEGIFCRCGEEQKDTLKKIVGAYYSISEKVKTLESRIDEIENKVKAPRK